MSLDTPHKEGKLSPDNHKDSSSRIRIFLGLSLCPEAGFRIFSLKRAGTEPIPGNWINPHDLHLTVLFGGEQDAGTLSRWKNAACTLKEGLSPLIANHQERSSEIHWQKGRNLLAVSFDRTLPFWMEAGQLSRTLSEALLPTERYRPFWPHLTLARNARLESRTLEFLSNALRKVFQHRSPVWNGVKLYESIPLSAQKAQRYQILSDHPFSGNRS